MRLSGARRVTVQLSATVPLPLVCSRLDWGDGTRLDLLDGHLATLQSGQPVLLSHVYPVAPTPYTILFTVEDAEGQRASAARPVGVRNLPPQVTMAITAQAQSVTVVPTASDTDGEIIDLAVYWGGREGVQRGVASGEPLTHHYPTRGGQWEVLTVAVDDEGASVSVRESVTVLSQAEATNRWGNSPGARCQEQKRE